MCENDDLIEACKSGYCDKVVNLLQRNFTVHVRDSKQATPLYYSCCHGYYDISRVLIQFGSEINARVQWGSTALHAAADRGHIDCVKLLIHSGADLSIQNNRGDTAVHLCAYRGYIEIVKVFIQHNTNLFIKNNNEKTPSDEAEGNNHHNTAELLRQNMIAIQTNFGHIGNQQIREIPLQANRSLPSNVHSPASMSIPPSTPQKNDNFVRYSSDLTGFTRQSAPITHTDLKAYNRPNSHPSANQYRPENDQRRSEKSYTFIQNGGQNGHSSPEKFRNGTLNMIDNNRTPLHVQGRVAMESFAETLQIQLVKKIEECDSKDKIIKQLTETIQTQNDKLTAINLAFVRVKEENEKLIKSNASDITDSSSLNERILQCKHQGILDALQLLKQRNHSLSGDEHSLQSLKEVLKTRMLTQAQPTSLDVPNKEWKVGKDYILLGDKPLNYFSDEDRDGSCSLVFLINHKKKEYVLKMMTNLINLQANQHGEGHSMDQFLLQNFGPEHDIPIRLPHHPNVVNIRHFYMGATDRFKKFMNLLIPTKIDVPIEMANRTSFLVMDKYPQTLKSFMIQQRSAFSEPSFGLSANFILQLLYQILSAVHHLQKNGVVHRDIKADNIFLDNCLRPVLTDFGFAKTLTYQDGSPVTLTDGRQVFAGNSHAWAPELTRFSRGGPPTDRNEEMTTLQQVYGKTDAYAVSRMFYSLIRPIGDGDIFPQSSISRPHYENSDIPELPGCYQRGLCWILRNLVLDDPVQRISERKAVLCAGMMLFYPRNCELRIESDSATYCQARILSLLSMADKSQIKPVGQSLTMEQSVEALTPVLESDFLFNISPSEFWETFQYLKMRDLL